MYSSKTRAVVQCFFCTAKERCSSARSRINKKILYEISRNTPSFHLFHRLPALQPAAISVKWSSFASSSYSPPKTGSATAAQPCMRRWLTSTNSPRFSPQTEAHITILERLHALENKVRIYGYSTIRWGLGLVAVLALGVYIFRESLRENVADEVAEVASRSLGDENLVLKANEVTKIVLKDILNDPATMELVSSFFLSILRTEMVTKGAMELVQGVLQDPQTQKEINKMCTTMVRHLLEDKETMNQLQMTIKHLLENEQTRNACKQLLHQLAKDEAIQNFMAEFLSDVMTSSTVKEKAVTLSKDVTQEVMGDAHIQEETGNALWNAFVYSVTPSWFSPKD